MAGGWGLGGWGLMPWGLAGVAGATLTVSNAFALGTQQIRVTVSKEPAHANANRAGDALNPATWSVKRLDTSELLSVIAVDSTSDKTIYDLTILEEMGSSFVSHQVSSTSLLTAAGEIVQTANSAQFIGVLDAERATSQKRALQRGYGQQDIANPPLGNAGLTGSSAFGPANYGSELGGTLVITSAGDYANEAGAALVKKLIIRRIITSPGEFFHLRDYGIGLRIKEPLPTSDLVKLKTSLEKQVARETEVEAVQAKLSFASDTLSLAIRVRLKKTGQVLDIPLQIQANTVQF